MSAPLSSLQFLFKDTIGGHQVTAHADNKPVGVLEWAGSGHIENVKVFAEHRRKGIATALLNESRRVAQEKGLESPRHSARRSESGDAWARSLGEPLPERKTDREYFA